jgi:NAD(P)-dependent dehydrogenase (short-subunit alcohol dehydrogenase family)
MNKKVCLITGVGPGTGTALAEKFSSEYHVAMIARDEARLSLLEDKLAGARGFCCDVSDTVALKDTLDSICSEMGDPSVVIHNAVGGGWGEVTDIDPALLAMNFQINTMAMLHLIQRLSPTMLERGEGAILATGNTAAYRGRAKFAAFAPTKAAQRILMESAARSLGPGGIHVAYVAIDAAIDVPWTREMLPDAEDDFFAMPEDIAAECFHIAHQPRSSWTFDVLIRPFGETW